MTATAAGPWLDLGTVSSWPLTLGMPLGDTGTDFTKSGARWGEEEAQRISNQLRKGGIESEQLTVRHTVDLPQTVHVNHEDPADDGVYIVPKLKTRWVTETYTVTPARGNAFRAHRWRLEVVLYDLAFLTTTPERRYPNPPLPSLSTLF